MCGFAIILLVNVWFCYHTVDECVVLSSFVGECVVLPSTYMLIRVEQTLLSDTHIYSVCAYLSF